MNTNRQYVSDAKRVKEKAPEVFEQVREGRITIPEAKREIRRREKAEEHQRALERFATQDTPPTQRCRLIVGQAENLSQLQDATVDIIITSPPYNLGSDEWPMGGGGRSTRAGIDYSAHGDDMPQEAYEQWQVDVLREMYRLAKPGASFFYNCKVRTLDGQMIHPMRWLLSPANPWTLRQEVIWHRKSTHNHSATLFWPIDERIYWMTKGTPVLRSGKIGQPTVWEEFGPVPDTWHPAPFTEKLPRMLLTAVGVDPSTTVLDPFSGSCTTVKVALDMGCYAIGADISREYLERAIVERNWSSESLY